RVSIQTALNTISTNVLNNESSSTTPFTQNGIEVYYTKNAFPTGNMTLLGVNYYDQYPARSPAQPVQIQNQTTLGGAPVTITSNGWSSVRSIKTYPTGSYVKNIENDSWTSSFIWYDTLGRVIGTYGKNPLGGFTKTESILDFSGKALETYTYHSRNTSSAEVTVKDRYVYSPQHYLSKHYQQINANPEELLSEYTYNDLGQITNKRVGSSLQSIDYTYNIRGWLTGINPNDLSGVNNKLFAYKLKYNTVEGAENPNNSYTNLKVKPRYNGGIAEVDWKTAYGANEPLRRYGYVYDGANRLRAGFFQIATNPYSKEYSEVMDYDLNGNINTLNRTGASVSGTAEVMDDLTYTYNGNRLSYIKESGRGNALSGYPLGAGQGQTIGYDGNGNMISHLDKGVTKIAYNYLDLASSFTLTDASKNSSYIYMADGSKVQTSNNGKITDYLDGFQYESTTGTLTTKILANEEGYFDFINNRYVYQYVDHLGNIRLSYTKNPNGGTTILEENNYYPLGLKHSGYNTGDTTNNKFKYLYNGKELQSSGNLDYGWRQYMPDLGRWFGMDALSESYHMASPYAYVMNNPVSFFDPNGMLSQSFMDELGASVSGTTWTNNNNGTFTNNWGDTMTGGGIGVNFNSSKGHYWGRSVSLSNDGGGGEAVINIPAVNITGSLAIDFGLQMRNHINDYMSGWNAQSDLAWKKWSCPQCFDGPVNYIGSAGDPAGVFDIGGQVISTWKPENRYLAMGAGILAAVALRKPGLATKEATGTYYSVAFEMKLAEGSYPGVYRGGHFREANKALEAMMKTDAKFAASIDELGIVIPKSPTGSILGKSPKNWVWHHHVDDGIMQLVPKPQHTVGSSFWKTMHPGNKGGFSIWGK
ncbi:hypothetical protein EGI16_17405, partial [Chryseobacterium sp. G0240]|uniref:RHS repeat-associated core domain-containing protein n=1 Tax=Chryseobacterium sp. G0240 TaxID=2487066 RepID=UPI000F927589